MIYILIGFIFLIYLVRKSNTDDLIKQANITTDDQKNKLAEESLKYKTTKFSCLLFSIALISLVAIAAIRLTSLEVAFLDYFGTGINHKEVYISPIWYITPFFVLVIRGIIIEVNLGDYVLRTYNLKEEEIDTKEALNSIKGMFYKKAPATTTPAPVATTEPQQTTVQLPETTTTQPTQEATPEPVTEPTPVVEATPVQQENSTPTPVAPVAPVAEQQEQTNVNPFAV